MTMQDIEIKEKETLKFDAEVGKVLQLVIHSLYTNRDIFLRELISNASDACDKLRYQSLINSNILGEDSELRIKVSYDKKKKTITIEDNGIGMSRQELIENLGTIARSGTQNFIKALSDNKDTNIELIGQFGVGFYSSFMVADEVEVISKSATSSDNAYIWISKGDGEFTIEPYEGEFKRGTKITLFLRKKEEEFLDWFRLEHIIKTYSDHVAFPIELTGEEGKNKIVNSASALWLRPKSEITEEQYKEFFKATAHEPGDPWMIIHHKAEGKLEFTSLLFIPSHKPFDLLHPDRRCRIKLYVKRVFITEEGVKIIPQYLRFMRGVVDSEDLPLNISRETLQHNVLIDKIRNAITKKILSELKKKAEKEPERFIEFWEKFGGVLKEGLCDSMEPRDDILEVVRFYTTISPTKPVSLEEYIGRMKNGQEHIYYLTGDDIESMQKSPQIEGFKKRGIEVLLLTDPVDDFWVNVVHDYKKKELKSVTRSGSDLERIASEKNADNEDKVDESEIATLIAYFKSVLGDAVQDVKASTRLTESPVCLAVDEKAMDIRMERFLHSQMQIPGRSSKILEINPNHKIIKKIAQIIKEQGNTTSLEDLVFLLFDQANIVEGEEVKDPTAFSRRMTELLIKAT